MVLAVIGVSWVLWWSLHALVEKYLAWLLMARTYDYSDTRMSEEDHGYYEYMVVGLSATIYIPLVSVALAFLRYFELLYIPLSLTGAFMLICTIGVFWCMSIFLFVSSYRRFMNNNRSYF